PVSGRDRKGPAGQPVCNDHQYFLIVYVSNAPVKQAQKRVRKKKGRLRIMKIAEYSKSTDTVAVDFLNV
ncbi:MAG: hypothetical protein WC328_10770, partial [Kiritimatiellia bacterium]